MKYCPMTFSNEYTFQEFYVNNIFQKFSTVNVFFRDVY